jgi:succinate-acetate transporter protein
MNNKAAITSTVGYMCLALTGWMVSMPNAGWFDQVQGHGTAMLFPLALVLIVMGILAFVNERTLDAVIFFGGAGLFWSAHEFLMGTAVAAGGPPESTRYTGWYWFIWAVFFCYVWLGSFKAGLERMLFLLGLWLTLLALAIAGWTDLHGFQILGGYLGLATAILAAITSAMAVIGHGTGRFAARTTSTAPA